MHGVVMPERSDRRFPARCSVSNQEPGANVRYLSICAIHKFETSHLREWIDYHRLIGVEHFYLADNNDDSNEAGEVLAPYIHDGLVTSIHIPGRYMQIPVYNRLLSLVRSVWAAFIDLDEFVFPTEASTLSELLCDYEKYGGLVANWFCFGSSGLIERPNSVLRQLHYRAKDDFEPNRHIKSIVQPAKVVSYDHPHFPTFKQGSFNVNEDFERVEGAFQPPRQRRLRINHYILRSRQDFMDKAKRARCDTPGNPYTDEYWNAFDQNNIYDDRIWAKFESALPANIDPLQNDSPQPANPLLMPTTNDTSMGESHFRPIYWCRVPQAAMQRLRDRGFHDGYWKSPAGTDVLLDRVFCGDLREAGRDRQIEGLRLWATFVERESYPLHGFPALWHPHVDADLVREAFGDNRVIAIQGDSESEALFEFHLTKWRLGVFYHVACIGNWREVTAEQLDLCRKVGLDGLHVICLGDREQRLELELALQMRGIEYASEYWSSDLHMYEVPSITLLQDWCRNHRSAFALYFHTKGVSSPDDLHKRRWRSIMEREVIARWKENARILKDGVDVVGVNWRDTPPTSHMPGNFYMARAEFVSENLQDFGQYYRHPPFWDSWPSNSHRLQCEFWLGSYRTEPRVHSLVSYNERIDQTDYFQRHPV